MFPGLYAPGLLYRVSTTTRVCRVGRVLTFQSDGVDSLQLTLHTENLVHALLALTGPGIAWEGLIFLASRDGGAAGQDTLEACLDLLGRHRMLEFVWVHAGTERGVVTALSPRFQFAATPPGPECAVVLSRFAFLRRDGDRIVVESPESLGRFELTCLQTWYQLAALSQPISISDALLQGQNGLAELIAVLWGAGFLERTDVAETTHRATWEFHDLLFHWRSRGGRVAGPQSGTFRFLHRWDSPPAIKSAMSEEPTKLTVPTEIHRQASSLTEVMERRRSTRRQSDVPISLDQVARLLYHTVRIQKSFRGEHEQLLLLRPVPAAGAIHEIEVYLAVGRCSGLERGLYHYHGERHELYRLTTGERELSALLDEAASSWGQPEEPPQILLILSSRFPRLAWKYEGIAYRLTLINAGVIFQSMYLLATEMGLACSALGGGDSELFAAASGLAPFAETSIAEFALGSLAD